MGKGVSETLLGISLSNTIFSILALPILLIHGYSEDSHVWDSWLKWLKADNIPAATITFHQHNDKCGTVAEHAAELNKLIHGHVNIIAHSKGGLDARWYIAHNNPDKVANLIMIATPNAGTTAAYIDLTSCAFQDSGSAGLVDLQPGSKATQSTNNQATHYFTIAGNYASPCYFVIERICNVVDSDGLVTVANAKSNYTLLEVFPYNHNGLLTHRDVYEKVLPILLSHG